MPEAKILFINKSATSKKLTQSDGTERSRIFSHVQRSSPALPATAGQERPPVVGRLDATGTEVFAYAVTNEDDLRPVFPRPRRGKAKSKQADSVAVVPVASVPSPANALTTAQVDPFDNLRMPVSLYMKDIFAFYNSDLVSRVFPIKAVAMASREHTMSLALQDPVLLSALLCTSSAAIYRFTGSTTHGVAAMQFKGEALRRLHAKLETPEYDVEISSVFAVSLLIWIECLHGSTEGLKVHLAGLDGLVARVGDITEGPLPIISTIWNASYQCSAILGIRPSIIPIVLCESQTSQPARDVLRSNSDMSRKRGLGSRFFTKSNMSILGPQLAAIVKEQSGILQLQSLGDYLDLRLTEADYAYLYTKKMALEYELLCVRCDYPITPAQNAVRLALFTIVQPIILFTPSTATFCRAMSGQIEAALRRYEQEVGLEVWDSSEDMLLWVLFVGSLLSEGCKENAWFVIRLARVMRYQEIGSKTQLLSLLTDFYYWPGHFGSKFERIWIQLKSRLESM